MDQQARNDAASRAMAARAMSMDFSSLRLEALMQVKFARRLPEEPDCMIQQPSETAEIGISET
jgi:hypothetical protein